MSTFAEWLKERRRELGLKQEELASSIGYSVATIRKLEQGLRTPSLQMIRLLASHLEVPESGYAEILELARSKHESKEVSNVPSRTGDAAGSKGRGLAGVAGTVPNNLPPSPLTRLIGREEAVEELHALLADVGVRLITLTGSPGIGKTSLALRVASGQVEHSRNFRDGIFFINLAPIREVSFVADVVAGALGLEGSGDSTSFRTLVEQLHSKRMLLVLDNFEQVVDAASELAGLLVSCPGIKVLVTSRETLNVRGEHIFPVPTLEVPDVTAAVVRWAHSSIEHCAAVELLVERAVCANPHFRLTDQNAAAIAQVCFRLEGLPLALEMVAARTRLFSMDEIVARLDHSLSLLVGGPRDLSPRQQTLRTAIEWSYNLLSAGEQALFARLAVFTGGWTYPAAEAICNARGDLSIDVLQGLDSLLNKSLLRAEQREGERRLSMLETIREYALEKLEESGYALATRHIHAEYFLTLAEVPASSIPGLRLYPGQKAWLDRLEHDHDNLRAALQWTVGNGEMLLAARLAGALGRFWETHGHVHEGRQWLRIVLDKSSTSERALSPRLVALLLVEAGALASVQADYNHSILLYEDALRLLQSEDDTAARANVLYHLSRLRNEIGNSEQAEEAASESLALYKAVDDKLGTANMLNMLGTINFYSINEEQGIELYNESLALYQEVGARQGAANVLNNLGEIARLRGDYARAADLYRMSLEPCRELGDRKEMSITLNNLGYMALNMGDPQEAKRLFSESLKVCESLGSPRTTALGLYGMASVLGAEGRLAEAAQLFGTAQALTEKINTSYAPADRADFERQIAYVRSCMSEEAWNAAWNVGYSTSSETYTSG